MTWSLMSFASGESPVTGSGLFSFPEYPVAGYGDEGQENPP